MLLSTGAAKDFLKRNGIDYKLHYDGAGKDSGPPSAFLIVLSKWEP
jgi:hypothetical protein